MTSFFISYNQADRAWAEWIGWILEEAEHDVVIEAWDFRPGGNFALEMQAAAKADKTIAVLSENYLNATFTHPEWAAAFAQDPQGLKRKLLTVRVQECEPEGLLGSITRIDLFCLNEEDARQAILNAPLERAKPFTAPPFPLVSEAREKPSTAPPFPLANGDRPEQALPKSLAIPPNPFVPINGMVDQAHQFFGREKELRSVFEILNGGSSVAIIGGRQVGKSSLLKAIAREAANRLHQPRRPVYLNLQDVYDEADFYEALCEELRVEVAKGRRLAQAVRKLEPKVLLLLDELEKMTWDGFTEQVRSQLRGLAEGGDAPLRLVVSASVTLGELFPDSHGTVSPLRNICLEEPLGLWDEGMVRSFVGARLMGTPVGFAEEEILRIVADAEGNPQRIMLACFRLYSDCCDRLNTNP